MVFDVPAQVMDRAPADPEIEVSVTLNRNVRAACWVREVAPQADPVTGTFEVKVGLIRPPAEYAARVRPSLAKSSSVQSPGIEIPASVLTRADGQPAVWVVDDATETVNPAQHRSWRATIRPGWWSRRGSSPAMLWSPWCPGAATRTAGPPAGRSAMIGPNLSEWAIQRRSLIVYFMIAAVLAGAPLSFFRLGRNEDPAFAVRTMVVQAAWPGATLEDTVLQVTERIERPPAGSARSRLPDTATLVPGSPRSSSICGATCRGARSPTAGYETPGARRWATSGTRCRMRCSGRSSTTSSATSSASSTASPPMASPIASCAITPRRPRSRLLLVPDVSKIEIIGAQDEQVFLEFSSQRLAALGLDYPALVAALQAQNAIRPAGVLQTGDERLALRVSGAFDSELDILAVNFVVGGRVVRLGDIAEVRRGYADPPQPLFRVNGEPAIGLGDRDAGRRRHSGPRLKTSSRRWPRSRPSCPIGIEPILVADQAVTVDLAINDFTTSLWQAILIIIAASFLSLGVRPGAVVALSIPLTLAIVFPIMEFFHPAPPAHLARRPDHRARPARRRRHDHGRRHDPAGSPP